MSVQAKDDIVGSLRASQTIFRTTEILVEVTPVEA